MNVIPYGQISSAIILLMIKTALLLSALMFNGLLLAKNTRPPLRYLPHAELVVVANVYLKKDGDMNIKVKKVLKGDESYKLKTIEIPSCAKPAKNIRGLSFHKNKAKKHTLLFKKNWLNKRCDTIIHAYDKSFYTEIKILLEYQSISNERKRLKQLLKLLPHDDFKTYQIVRNQFRNMSEPRNLDLFFRLVNKLEKCSNKRQAVDGLADTYDLRAVKYLKKLLPVETCQLNKRAARLLRDRFPGAPGVSRAFKKYTEDPDIGLIAKRYLMARYDNPKYTTNAIKPAIWYQASELLKQKKFSEAVEKTFELFSESACTNTGSTIKAIIKVLPYMNEQQLNRLHQYIQRIPLSEIKDNFLTRWYLSELFVLLKDEQYLPMLLVALEHEKFPRYLFEQILLIKEWGNDFTPDALQILANRPYRNNYVRLSELLSIYWLEGNDLILELLENKPLRDSSHTNVINQFLAMDNNQIDFDFLKQAVLNKHISQDSTSMLMILKHLKRIKDPRSIPLLFDVVSNYENGASSYKPGQPLIDALLAVYSAELKAGATEFLSSPNEAVRIFAAELMVESEKEASLPWVRKMFLLPDYGDHVVAARALRKYGQITDIEILLPYCNYWNNPTRVTRQACSALTYIRKRNGLDLSGPINNKD